jgi:ribonuclease VapC
MIVDTSALLAIASDVPERIRFEDAIEGDPVRLISAASVLEGAIVMARRAGRAAASEAVARLHELLDQLGLEIEPVFAIQISITEAAHSTFGKGIHPAGLNFGDCFAYALAKETGEPLLFKGLLPIGFPDNTFSTSRFPYLTYFMP